ncbi:MAG: ATP-binding protein [Bacteroidetes bacterium]|nr:ATP-binding protein [Bacteroidota bacterium]
MDFDFTEDRGPAKYFHGRKQIIHTFNSALRFYRTNKRGTTFLIQGAPGAGKTALLDVLSNQAKPKGWEAAMINGKDLYDPISMAQSLGESYLIDKEYALNVGIKFLGGGLVASVAGHASSEEILKRLAPENGLILLLDEAQDLRHLKNTPKEHNLARDALNVIHNGNVGRPVMLIAGGLGTTESTLGGLGISRFEGDCTVQLGRLDKESECAVIRDWLTQAGGAIGDPGRWIDSIAEQAHGWPQHIISYIKPAVKYLTSNHGRMTDEGLAFVYEKGNEYREEYYQKRVKGIDKKKRQDLAKIFAGVPLGDTMELEDIMDALKEEYTEEVAEKLFKKALERGIIDERKDGDYGIPIPSFHTWLVDQYVQNKSQYIPPPAPKQLPAKPEQFLLRPKKDDESNVNKNKCENEDKRKGGGGFSMER